MSVINALSVNKAMFPKIVFFTKPVLKIIAQKSGHSNELKKRFGQYFVRLLTYQSPLPRCWKRCIKFSNLLHLSF
jgi:hypothetical protein